MPRLPVCSAWWGSPCSPNSDRAFQETASRSSRNTLSAFAGSPASRSAARAILAHRVEPHRRLVIRDAIGGLDCLRPHGDGAVTVVARPRNGGHPAHAAPRPRRRGRWPEPDPPGADSGAAPRLSTRGRPFNSCLINAPHPRQRYATRAKRRRARTTGRSAASVGHVQHFVMPPETQEDPRPV